MSVLIFSIVIGLLNIFSTQPAVSHADIMVAHSVTSLHVDQQRMHPISYSPTHRGIVGVVSATTFASCYTARYSSVTLGYSDLPSDGPICVPAPSRNFPVSNGGAPLLIFPLTAEGILEERVCVAITAPQAYCDIPSGSPLSAFPLV